MRKYLMFVVEQLKYLSCGVVLVPRLYHFKNQNEIKIQKHVIITVISKLKTENEIILNHIRSLCVRMHCVSV